MAQDSLALDNGSLWSIIQSIPALIVSSIIQTIKGPSFFKLVVRPISIYSISCRSSFVNLLWRCPLTWNVFQTLPGATSIMCLKCCKVFFKGPLNVRYKYDTMTCIYTIPKDKGFAYNHHLYGNVVLHFQPYIIWRNLCVAFHCKAAEVLCWRKHIQAHISSSLDLVAREMFHFGDIKG